MRPSFAIYDLSNRLTVNAVFCAKVLGALAAYSTAVNRLCLAFGQLGSYHCLAVGVALLSQHVSCVLGSGSSKQVLGPNAAGDVAAVTDEQSCWDWAPRELERNAMCAEAAVSAVPLYGCSGRPEPTRSQLRSVWMGWAGLVDLRPKTCNVFRIHELIPRGSDAGVFSTRRRFIDHDGAFRRNQCARGEASFLKTPRRRNWRGHYCIAER